jgi:hypothetical protein
MAALTRSGARKASEIVIYLPHAAALTCGDAFGTRSGVGDEFVEPTAARAIDGGADQVIE